MQGQRIGYVRVSSFDQNPERQLDRRELIRKMADAWKRRTEISDELDDTLAEAKRIVDETARPNGGILIDNLHLRSSGAVPADVTGYDRSLFPYIQIADAPLVCIHELPLRRVLGQFAQQHLRLGHRPAEDAARMR